MFKKVLILTTIVLTFAASHLQAAQISCNWVGCEDGFWSDPTNWDCGMAPDNNETYTFVVTIDTSSCSDEVHIRLQQDRKIDRLDCYGELKLDRWMQWWPWLRLEDDVNGLTNHSEVEIERIEVDGKVNMMDFGTVANYWLRTSCGTCGGADSTGDGSVNFADMKVLCDNWLKGK